MRTRARIIAADPEAIADELPFRAVVEQNPEPGWDDDEPPDETVLYFTMDVGRELRELSIDRPVEIRLDQPDQLVEPSFARAIAEALDDGHEVTIKVRGRGR